MLEARVGPFGGYPEDASAFVGKLAGAFGEADVEADEGGPTGLRILDFGPFTAFEGMVFELAKTRGALAGQRAKGLARRECS